MSSESQHYTCCIFVRKIGFEAAVAALFAEQFVSDPAVQYMCYIALKQPNMTYQYRLQSLSCDIEYYQTANEAYIRTETSNAVYRERSRQGSFFLGQSQKCLQRHYSPDASSPGAQQERISMQ